MVFVASYVLSVLVIWLCLVCSFVFVLCMAMSLCLWCCFAIGFHGFLLVGFLVLAFYVLRVLGIGLGKRKVNGDRG